MTSLPLNKMAEPSFTSSATDAFDAIVQAANPSHPNHAAWVEKFGGSVPRRMGTRGVDGEEVEGDFMERSSSARQRRRRASTNGSKGGELASHFSQAEPHNRSNGSGGFGKAHTRAHTSAVDESPLYNSIKVTDRGEGSQSREVEPLHDDPSQKKRRKKRDKGKARGSAPPVPPPRTTSHGLHQVLPDSVPSVHETVSSMNSSTLPDPPATPSTPATPGHFGSSHSRTTSASHYATASSNGNPHSPVTRTHPKTISNDITPKISSPFRGRFTSTSAEPPARLSSMLSRGGEVNEEQMLARQAAAYSGPFTQHDYGNGGGPSVDFALPEDVPRRGSMDNNTIRKSFDALISPFRSVRKGNHRQGVTSPNSDMISPSPPILRSPSMDLPNRHMFNSSSAFTTFQGRPLSSVRDERESGDVWGAPMNFSSPQSGLEEKPLPLHPFATSADVGNGRRQKSGNMTEDGEDFFDAKSDEGGNGSSAEEKRKQLKLSNGHQTTPTKKKAKRKSLEYHNAARARAKLAASGLGVEALEGFPTVMGSQMTNGSAENVDSSASDVEDSNKREGKRKPVPSEREREESRLLERKASMSKRKPVHVTSADHPPTTASMREDSSADIKVEGSIEQVPARKLTPEEQWRERFESNIYFLPPSTSTRSLGQMYRSEAINQMPMAPPVLPVSQSSNSTKVIDGDRSIKSSIGRNNRGFAGVMARMRKDRTPSTSVLNSGNQEDSRKISMSFERAIAPSFDVERNDATSFGLGIAAPGIEGVEVPQKRWRNRLTSFSNKSTKSPKVEQDEWKRDQHDEPPLPPMPDKARRLLISSEGKPSLDIDAIQRRQLMEDAINQSLLSNRGAHTSPLESREFVKRPDTLRESSSPTIHKTLSPALLTEQNHEADEVLSFIGSDRDSEGKRGTWTSLSNFELPPGQTVDSMTTIQSHPIGLQITRPSVDSSSKPEMSTDGHFHSLNNSMTMRRFSNGNVNLIKRVSDRGLRMSPPAALDLTPPRQTPVQKSPSRSPMGNGIQQSPPPTTLRSSIDIRMPSFTRSRPRTPNVTMGSPETLQAPFSASLTPDQSRSPIYYQPSTPSFKESLTSPKMGMRLFSGGKSKGKSKGISSTDYVSTKTSPIKDDTFPSRSRSDVSLSGGIGGVGNANNGSNPYQDENENERMLKRNSERLEEMDDGILKAQEATKLLAIHMDNMAITPTSTLHSHSLPQTPIIPQHTDDETSAFDKMLRDSAKEDAARVKQIATRTAQEANGATVKSP